MYSLEAHIALQILNYFEINKIRFSGDAISEE